LELLETVDTIFFGSYRYVAIEETPYSIRIPVDCTWRIFVLYVPWDQVLYQVPGTSIKLKAIANAGMAYRYYLRMHGACNIPVPGTWYQ